MHRLRMTFARTAAARHVSHLELIRMWERVFRRAGLPIAYSQGFNPHPRLFFGSPLATGLAAEREPIDVYVQEEVEIHGALDALRRQMPRGFLLQAMEEVPLDEPPLQRLVVAAEYQASLPLGLSGETAIAVKALLDAESIPREKVREGKSRRYDLRPMIRDVTVEEGAGGRLALKMVLRSDSMGVGRPDEVLRALRMDPAECEITRTRLILEETYPPLPSASRATDAASGTSMLASTSSSAACTGTTTSSISGLSDSARST